MTKSNYNDWYCLMHFDGTYALPFFQHYGTSSDEPTPCKCGVNGLDKKCHEFDFLIGAMFYDHSKNYSYNGVHTYRLDQYTDEERAFLPLLEYLFGGPLSLPKTIKDDDLDEYYAAWLSTTPMPSRT